jgi:hypothetical protein
MQQGSGIIGELREYFNYGTKAGNERGEGAGRQAMGVRAGGRDMAQRASNAMIHIRNV